MLQAHTCETCMDEGKHGGIATVIGTASACGHQTSSRGYAYCMACSLSKRKCQFCGKDISKDAQTSLLPPKRRTAKIMPIRHSAGKRPTPSKKH